MLPILVNESKLEPTVNKKANQFIAFKVADIQLPDFLNFLGDATSPYSFLTAYKVWETKGFFLYEWFDHPDKMQNTKLPPYDAFYSKLGSCNPPETETKNYVDLLKTKSGLTTEQAVIKLKLSKPVLELRIVIFCNRHGSRNNWAHSSTFCGGTTLTMLCQPLRQCKKWSLFTTTKISICWSFVVHYQTSLTFAYTTLPMQKSILSQRETKTYCRKSWKHVIGGPPIVFTGKADVDEKFIQKSRNKCKSIARIGASPL